MIKINMNNQRLQEVYEIAESEQRTLLGVIYNDYIIPHLSPKGTINSKNIYANRKLVMKLIELEKELNSEEVEMIYLQFGPSTNKKGLKEDELLLV